LAARKRREVAAVESVTLAQIQPEFIKRSVTFTPVCFCERRRKTLAIKPPKAKMQEVRAMIR